MFSIRFPMNFICFASSLAPMAPISPLAIPQSTLGWAPDPKTNEKLPDVNTSTHEYQVPVYISNCEHKYTRVPVNINTVRVGNKIRSPI